MHIRLVSLPEALQISIIVTRLGTRRVTTTGGQLDRGWELEQNPSHRIHSGPLWCRHYRGLHAMAQMPLGYRLLTGVFYVWLYVAVLVNGAAIITHLVTGPSFWQGL